MAEKERRLGRGLAALISAPPHPTARDAGGESTRELRQIPTTAIDPNPWQPRHDFSKAELDELAESIRANGMVQPIVVRRANDRFTLIAGERRLRACQHIGLSAVEAYVVSATDRQMLEWAIVENVQRRDLNAIEVARAFKRLLDEFDLTQEELAARVGQSRSHVANTLRLLDLSAEIQEMVTKGAISAGAARALLSIANPHERLRVAKRVADGALNVRTVEDLSRRRKTDEKARRVDPNLAAVAEDLQAALGTRVRIGGTRNRGRITIEYYTSGELDRVYALLRDGARERDESGAADGAEALGV